MQNNNLMYTYFVCKYAKDRIKNELVLHTELVKLKVKEMTWNEIGRPIKKIVEYLWRKKTT